MLSNFKLVSAMNTKFGNPFGDYGKVCSQMLQQPGSIEALLKKQIKGIESELVELNNAMAKGDIIETRDAICDVIVFAYGALHLLGVDGDEDMQAVLKGVMTRFCKNEDEMDQTVRKYTSIGVEVTCHRGYPFGHVRSGVDQQMPEYPKGKFLKSVNYKTAELNEDPFAIPGSKEVLQQKAEFELSWLMEQPGKAPTPVVTAVIPIAFPVGPYDYSSIDLDVPASTNMVTELQPSKPVAPTFEETQAAILEMKHKPIKQAAKILVDLEQTRADNIDKDRRWKAFVTSSTLHLEAELAKLLPQQQEALLSGKFVINMKVERLKE